LAAQDFSAASAVGQRLAAWTLHVLQDHQGQSERPCVGEHMGGVGQQRERVRQDSDDDLERHESDDEHEGDAQIPPVRVSAHAVRVTPDPVPVISVIVTLLAHVSMPILITI
jgi:hypothetical protein